MYEIISLKYISLFLVLKTFVYEHKIFIIIKKDSKWYALLYIYTKIHNF